MGQNDLRRCYRGVLLHIPNIYQVIYETDVVYDGIERSDIIKREVLMF